MTGDELLERDFSFFSTSEPSLGTVSVDDVDSFGGSTMSLVDSWFSIVEHW